MTLSSFALQVLLLLASSEPPLTLQPGPRFAVAHTCRWSFPGGTPSSSSSCTPPAVRYRTPGIKGVTLTVCEMAPHGRCTTVRKQLTVLDLSPSIVEVVANPAQPYVGDTLRLTAKASGKPPLSWLWTLPRSATSRTNPATVATARLAPGLLTIRLRVSNAYGSSTRTTFVRLLEPKPVLTGFSLSSTTPVLGTVLRATPNVTGRPPLAFHWTLDAHPISTDRELAWQVADVAPGSHTLALRVSNASGSTSLARTVTLQQPLIRDFRPVCPNLLCLFPAGRAVAFDLTLDPSAHPIRYEYDWTGNGAFTESSSAPVSLHIFEAPGNYRPRVRITILTSSETRLASQFLLVTRDEP